VEPCRLPLAQQNVLAVAFATLEGQMRATSWMPFAPPRRHELHKRPPYEKSPKDRFGGHFYNSEYGISGTIVVMVHGNTQSVRLSSEAGWALLKLSR
jgi:hypothetical protein